MAVVANYLKLFSWGWFVDCYIGCQGGKDLRGSLSEVGYWPKKVAHWQACYKSSKELESENVESDKKILQLHINLQIYV